MKYQNETKTIPISIDEPTAESIMNYYGIDNHDELVRYVKSLGIEHND
jgi:hypothetical protein